MGKQIITWFRRGYPFHRVAFWLSFVLSVVFLGFGLVSPPPGIIDGSVLGGVGILFAFAALGAAIKAVEDGKDVSIHKGNTDVTIGDINPSCCHQPDYPDYGSDEETTDQG